MNIKYRVTYTNKEGVRYTDEFEDEDDAHSVGCWDAPFPNTKEESTAFGLWECLGQSDDCPSKFLESPPIKIRVEKISCNPRRSVRKMTVRIGCSTCQWNMTSDEYFSKYPGRDRPCEDCKRNPTIVDRYERRMTE